MYKEVGTDMPTVDVKEFAQWGLIMPPDQEAAAAILAYLQNGPESLSINQRRKQLASAQRRLLDQQIRCKEQTGKVLFVTVRSLDQLDSDPSLNILASVKWRDGTTELMVANQLQVEGSA